MLHGLHIMDVKEVALSVLDSLHFSMVTLSTVGNGEMYPTMWFSKLFIDIEILMGLGITIFIVGGMFARFQKKKEPD